MAKHVYWALHNKLITELRKLGIHHSFKDRLPLAWYKHYIKDVTDDPSEIRELIDKCIALRCEGHEPEHKHHRYV